MQILTEATFNEEVKKSGLNLVIFVNPGCQVCEIVYPNIEEVEKNYHDQLKLFKVDAKANKNLMDVFSLKGVPQVLFFRDGKYLGKMAGPQDIEDYTKRVEEILAQ